MGTRDTLRACVLAMLASVVGSILPGCSDHRAPTTPQPVHYNLYATGSNYQQNDTTTHMYWYDADSLTLLDSLVLPDIALWGEASPDGRYLYLVMWPNKSIYAEYYILKLDMITESPVWTHEAVGYDEYSPFQMLDNGQLLVYGSEVIDAATGQTIRSTGTPLETGWELLHGPATGLELAVVQQDTTPPIGSDTLVMIADVTTGSRRGSFVPRYDPSERAMAMLDVRLHPDGRRILAHCERSSSQDAWFVIGDAVDGNLLLASRLSTWYGESAISADGTLAAVTDVANAFFGYGWPALYIYDLSANRLIGRFDSYNQLETWPGQVRFLPDDRRIVVFPDNGPTGHGWLQVLDLNTMRAEATIDVPFFEAECGALIVAPRPSL